ncbi:MAG: MFS transporter [Chthoniobacteraceae bacterium]
MKATSPEAEAMPEYETPELAAYYSNRPLMWRNLSLILLLNLGWAVSFTVVSPLIQLKLNSSGVAEGGLGFIAALNGWIYSYVVMYIAWKSDHTVSRFGRRIPYLFISAPIIIITVLIFPFSQWKWLLVALALLQMLFSDIKAATIPLLNIDCMPRCLLARTGAPASMIMWAMTFFAMRYGMQLSDWSETLPYLIAGAILTATTLIGAFSIKEPPIHEPTTEKFKPWSAMKVAWKDKRTILLMASVAILGTYQTVFNTWIWLYAKNTLHLSRTDTGMIISWAIPVTVALSFPVAWLIDRISPYKLLPWMVLSAGLSLCFLRHASTDSCLIIAAGFNAIAMLLGGAADIMVYRHSPASEIGSVTSTNSCLRGFYGGCVAFFTGYMIERLGGRYDYAFAMAFGLSVLGLILLFGYHRLMRSEVGSSSESPSTTLAARPQGESCPV